jgi:hypothetical protein
MRVNEQPVRFGWGTVIHLDEFPQLLARFQHNVPSRADKPTTPEIERRAADLAKGNFGENDLQIFIRTVCSWGGYEGIAGRVFKYNRIEQLAVIFRKAHQQAQNGEVVEALQTLQQIRHLGSVSFASKHLKFLAPERAVVLDSIISKRLAYPMNPKGYQDFWNDCNTILQHIDAANLEYTGWGASGWRISDVEMAITAKLRF